MRLWLITFVTGLIWGLSVESGFPQGTNSSGQSKRESIPTTELSVELVTGRSGVNRNAQKWIELFQKLKVSARIRSIDPRDKMGVTERNRGKVIRQVKVIAGLDRAGQMVLPDRIFTLNKSEELAEWLRELRTYGAQGSPEGQKYWGLNEAQFERVLNPLKRPLSEELQGKDLLTALRIFKPNPSADDLPLFITEGAKQAMANPDSLQSFPHSLDGMSKGTALAILLRHYGLEFHPRRTPSGELELAVRAAGESSQSWKIGWPLPKDRPRAAVAPKMFQLVLVSLEDLPLTDVLDAAQAAIDIPLLVDHFEIRELGINLAEIKVSYPERRATWSRVLKGIVFRARLRRELLVDEAGKPFVWITPIKFKRSPKGEKTTRR